MNLLVMIVSISR